MSKNSSFKEALGRLAAEKATPPASSNFPTVKVLLRAANITQPVDVIRALKVLGLSLRKAHLVLDRLAQGKKVPAELNAQAVDQDGLESLSSLGVKASKISSPTHVDVRAIREQLDLSQADFAARFGLELDTIRNWEQGRYAPDRAAVVLLAVIEHQPEAVDASLADNTFQRTAAEVSTIANVHGNTPPHKIVWQGYSAAHSFDAQSRASGIEKAAIAPPTSSAMFAMGNSLAGVVGIVGLGGTGSDVVEHLKRMGVTAVNPAFKREISEDFGMRIGLSSRQARIAPMDAIASTLEVSANSRPTSMYITTGRTSPSMGAKAIYATMALEGNA